MRSRPNGVAEGVPAEPDTQISSNWRLTPANDNRLPEDGFGNERAVEIIPSEQELENSLAELSMRYRQQPMMPAGGRHEAQRASKEIHAIPVEGDFVYGTHVDEDGNSHKVITRTPSPS